MPRTIGAAQFKEKCLTLIESLDADGIVITQYEKPVARVLPIEALLRSYWVP